MQARFLAVGKLLVIESLSFQKKSFFAFAACELIRCALKWGQIQIRAIANRL